MYNNYYNQIKDILIKNPIIIKIDKETKNVNEYILHQLILENIDSFF